MRFSPDKKEGLLREYGLEGSKIRFLSGSFNHTYTIQSPTGRKFALRVNTHSEHDELGLQAEIEWVQALRHDTDLIVPSPIALKDGRFTTKLGKYAAVVYDWLDGKDVGNDAGSQVMAELAKAMKVLHTHSKTFRLSPNAALPTLNDTLWGAPYRLGEAEREVFSEVVNRSNAALDKLKAFAPILIHFDLHFYNLKYLNGQLAIFDFDDCQFAWPEMDVAISFYNLRGHPLHKELEAVFWDHYDSDMRVSSSELESLIAGRQALLLNWFHANTNKKMADRVRAYTPKAMNRLSRFLETGVFSAIDP